AETVKILIQNGANVNALDNDGSAPLHYATSEVAEVLIKNGAKVNVRNKVGHLPLDNIKFRDDTLEICYH
ncbi:MAG: ankyrin repeat domain-containing protein, partial [Proteobacteria bacterium]|nr:ankyrin repeat domain-containing protein [Pseudomonadota bacterium]